MCLMMNSLDHSVLIVKTLCFVPLIGVSSQAGSKIKYYLFVIIISIKLAAYTVPLVATCIQSLVNTTNTSTHGCTKLQAIILSLYVSLNKFFFKNLISLV